MQSCGGVLLEIKIRNQDSLALAWVVLKDTRLYLPTTDFNGGAALRLWGLIRPTRAQRARGPDAAAWRSLSGSYWPPP